MFFPHVCCNWKSVCIIWNNMPHVRFTLSNTCLLLCCCPMSEHSATFCLSWNVPCPKSVSLCPTSVHWVMLLSHECGIRSICFFTGIAMPRVRFTQSNSCLLLCYCPELNWTELTFISVPYFTWVDGGKKQQQQRWRKQNLLRYRIT